MTYDPIMDIVMNVRKMDMIWLWLLQEMSASDANDLIGQFGVGFYSSFLGKYKVLSVCPFGSTSKT